MECRRGTSAETRETTVPKDSLGSAGQARPRGQPRSARRSAELNTEVGKRTGSGRQREQRWSTSRGGTAKRDSGIPASNDQHRNNESRVAKQRNQHREDSGDSTEDNRPGEQLRERRQQRQGTERPTGQGNPTAGEYSRTKSSQEEANNSESRSTEQGPGDRNR